jgi:ABC-type methionine transport system ATPase subunit
VIAAAGGPAARPRIEPALARAGLADRAGDRVSSYSQGMRQRLGIARCLLADPQLVILDEPMNGLDPGGISSLTGSRSVTLITVIGWNTLATSILFLATFLGSVRDLVLMMALGSLSPGQQVGSHAHPGSSIALDNFKLPMPAAVAVLIILAWAVLPAAAGALRTRTLDA